MPKRLVGLDCLRVFYAAVICAFHTSIHLGCNYGFLQMFIENGAVLMTSFFMLSGFALSISQKEASDGNLVKFYKKRIIAILPIYYICAFGSDLVGILYSIINGDVKDKIQHVIFLAPIEALGLQSIFDTLFPYNHNGGTWFISCLLICYAFFPFIILLLKKIQIQHRIILGIILFGIVVYASFIVKWLNISGIYTNPFIRLFEFIIGVILGLNWNEQRGMFKAGLKRIIWFILGFVVLVAGITVASIYFKFENFMLYSWIVIPCTAWMISTSVQIETKSSNRVLKYLSELSYSFFLAQLFSNNFSKLLLKEFNVTNSVLKIGVGWISCIVIALVLHHFIELPVTNRLKRKYL